MSFTISGKMSEFGGPDDSGVGPNEELAFLDEEDLGDPRFAGLFLPEQPPGTTGLARRLNPRAFYVACRWPYDEVPKLVIRNSAIMRLRANGKTLDCKPADWGPHEDTGRVADLSPAAAEFLGLKTDDVVEGELIISDGAVKQPAAPAPAQPAATVHGGLSIGADHFVQGAERDLISGGRPMPVRRAVVIHFTGGASAKSSVEAMRERNVSAHLVIERDGKTIQCVGFDRTAGHAGPPGKSRWRDPKSGILYDGCNSCTIGIEIANAGKDDPEQDAYDWARRQPGFAFVEARHRNGGPLSRWEAYYKPQLEAVFAVSKALCERYNLDDVTGHDCIAPERKNDPGPAFPMEELRKACGFSGLPVVHRA